MQHAHTHARKSSHTHEMELKLNNLPTHRSSSTPNKYKQNKQAVNDSRRHEMPRNEANRKMYTVKNFLNIGFVHNFSWIECLEAKKIGELVIAVCIH